MSAFSDNGKETPKDFQVRLGPEELGRILPWRVSLNQK